MLGYLSADIICSEKGISNVRAYFRSQIEAIVFIIHRFQKLGNIPRDAFRPIAREQKYLMDYKNIYFIHRFT